MQEIRDRNRKWENEQKSALAKMCASSKPWADILAYVVAEDRNSKKMSNVRYKLKGFKEDTVYQLYRAIGKIVGVTSARQETDISGGKQNLETVNVQLADGTRIKVPYGRIDLPDAGKDAHVDINYDQENNELNVVGACELRFQSMLDEVMDEATTLLKTDSIYKNQAISLDANYKPTIMSVAHIDREFLVLSQKTQYELKGLYARIEKPEMCVQKGIPLKTGILLQGPYGTGKTLLAFKIAKRAVENNWVFVYLKDPTQLAKTLKMCKTLDENGNGVVVFLEDVDQVTRGNRDTAMQDILNTLDGGDTKDMNIIALFTTNHIELIEPTFLRGKRIGSIISMGYLDVDMAKEFIQNAFPTGGEYELETEGLEKFYQSIADSKIVPAFMAEIVEKVKSHMVFDTDNKVKVSYLQSSLESYLEHKALAETKNMGKSNSEIFAESFGSAILENPSFKAQVTDTLKELHDQFVG